MIATCSFPSEGAARQPATDGLAGRGSTPCVPTAQDRAFIAMQTDYRPYGGIARVHQLPGTSGPHSSQAAADVARLVAMGRAVGFAWNDTLWMPMFQFSAPGHVVAPGTTAVLAAFDGQLDGWELARWFISCNAALQEHSPVQCMDHALARVLLAARAQCTHLRAIG